MEQIVASVAKGSVAESAGIIPGDSIISINGNAIADIFDYRYLTQEKRLELHLKDKCGNAKIISVKKGEYEDLGLAFSQGLMDDAKRCQNKCVFCFVDQLPKGMRKTLYFKDDDSRLSFLSGNYVTLTNMSDAEIDRLCFYHLSPINISVHSIDPEVRARMLGNKRARDLMGIMEKLKANGISMNYQVVLCKGINDREHLDKTIEALASFIPRAESLSVVPVGLTKHRQGLPSLEGFGLDDSLEVIRQVNCWQEKLLASHQTRFAYAADEFYLSAGIPVPAYDEYEGFPQLENGVGMLSLFDRECGVALKKAKRRTPSIASRRISIATGTAAASFIMRQAEKVQTELPAISLDVHAIENRFFGESITVSGLLTGQDIIAQLMGKDLGETLLIPENALRDGLFLDDVPLQELSERLGVRAEPVPANGKAFVGKMMAIPSITTLYD
jgi:putative radical SAM enzyme (TIGR03279 family)